METAQKTTDAARWLAPRTVARRARRRGFSPADVYRHHFSGRPRKERLFLGSLGFFTGFGVARGITHAIRAQVGPFRNLSVGGRHLHHLVFGIGGLLGVGYLWLVLLGTDPEKERAASRATAAGFGAASALTLDELALWLNLQDVYWAKQGRESVDAVAAFGGLLSICLWGGPFIRDLAREFRKLLP
ncbi:MAG TPA: hypothetical protein VKF59_12000 [Candidatus Dormibacteraeota bacterium]|nr:hypothetical protein [Candidatus Dormibacteraeota bacterium]